MPLERKPKTGKTIFLWVVTAEHASKLKLRTQSSKESESEPASNEGQPKLLENPLQGISFFLETVS